MPNLPNLNVNGKTVDPNSVRQVNVPQGETPKSYVEKHESLIRKNFKDELYFESEGKLFVTEDKFVIENSGVNMKDAKIRFGAVPVVPILIDNEPDSHKVTELEIVGAAQHKAWLEKELDVEKGERVNLHDLQKQADKLFHSDKFLSVNFTPTATEKGIKLTLQVQEVPTKVVFHGADAQQTAALNQLFSHPLTQAKIAEGMEKVQAHFDKNQASLLRGLDFKINGNALEVMVSQVQVPTNLILTGMSLEDAKKVEPFFQKPLNYDNLKAGMEKMHQHFGEQGFVLPMLDFQVNGNDVAIKMSKAPRPTQLEFKGSTVYPQEELQKIFGEPHKLNMDSIQKGLQALQKKYADDGYVLMPPEGVSADLSKGVLTIIVKEAKIGDIELTGNDKTKSEVIMRELRQKADQPLNMKTLDEDLKRVVGTGLFGNVQKSIEPDPQNPDKVSIKIHTSEEKTSSFNVGAGYSMSNGPFGTASLTLGNVGGMNRKVSIDGTLGTKVWGGGLSYYDPWALPGRTSLGASIYHRQWEGPFSDETRTGAKVTLGRPLGDIYDSPWRADLTLDAQRIGIDDQYSVSGTGVDYRLGLKPSLTYNTLDDPVLPHSGTKWRLSAEPVWVSGRVLGKFDTDLQHNIPMGERFTLTGTAQGGTILGDAPLYEKYNNAHLGRGLMGWDSDGSLVGSNYVKAGVGVNAHIWGPVSLTTKVEAGDFFDGTNMKPKVGAGVGVNVKIGSLGILNAGYGFKLVGKEKDDSPGAFHIGFGIPF